MAIRTAAHANLDCILRYLESATFLFMPAGFALWYRTSAGYTITSRRILRYISRFFQ